MSTMDPVRDATDLMHETRLLAVRLASLHACRRCSQRAFDTTCECAPVAQVLTARRAKVDAAIAALPTPVMIAASLRYAAEMALAAEPAPPSTGDIQG